MSRAEGRGSAAWKRKYLVERFLGTLALVLLSPVLVGTALLVKATSKGPVFFVDTRLGRFGKPFRLIKYRTMVIDAPLFLGDDGKVLTLRRDPRVTLVGRFLRAGIDELPQLINVARGEMTLVGPRPDVLWEHDRYTRRQARRLELLPGITGLAQVVGGRYLGNEENYEIDVRYVDRSQCVDDLLIAILTVPYLMGWESVGARVLGSRFGLQASARGIGLGGSGDV